MADESEIRRRYLELVRQHSPEREPERFAEIRNAYEQLRDPVKRMERQLFEVDDQDSLDVVLRDVRSQLRNKRIPTQTLLDMAARL